jgi:hypothetical protein
VIPARLLPMLGYDGPRLVFAGVEVVSGEVSAVDFTLPGNLAHFTIPNNLAHLTLPENRAHFALREED